MRKIFFALVAMLVTVCSFAQNKSDNKITFNVGGELGLATGNLGNVSSLGLGATAQLEYALQDKTYITLNGGIIEYFGKKIPSTNTKYISSAAIPLIGGAKYFFADNFYGDAKIGVTIFSGYTTNAKFTFSPGLGFKINEKWDALLKYTGYAGTGGAFGVRIGYVL